MLSILLKFDIIGKNESFIKRSDKNMLELEENKRELIELANRVQSIGESL